MSLFFSFDVVALGKNLRQDARWLPARNSDFDDEPGSLEKKCLKNLGRIGRQPTMMPIAISAKLDRCQQGEDGCGTVYYLRPKPNSVGI